MLVLKNIRIKDTVFILKAFAVLSGNQTDKWQIFIDNRVKINFGGTQTHFLKQIMTELV